MREHRTRRLAALVLICLAAAPAAAQETVTYERGPDGVTYQVTRRVTQQLTPITEMQTREEKVFRPRVTTKLQTVRQNYLTPVTQYRWVSRLKGRFNPFVQPYWAQQLEPVTRWQTTESTVQVPTTSTEWVEERRTVQAPVVTYRTVQNETVSRVAMAAPPAAYQPGMIAAAPQRVAETPLPAAAPVAGRPLQVASRPAPIAGGQRMQSDPPRAASRWRSQEGVLYR
ncbi:MAG: hypothetical protein AAF790_03090 [Planctomycetota bacterium]